MNEVPLDALTAERFTALKRTTFAVVLEADRKVNLELTTVSEIRRSREFESFSLQFNGPTEAPLAQQTFRFTHPQLGWFDLFIVPVGAERGARQYEAVFNRKIPAPSG